MMSLEKRDVLAVYPRRKMECSEMDLEMAICILEGVLERKDNMENLLRIHFSIPKTREQYIKTFILAAECMKGIAAEADLCGQIRKEAEKGERKIQG